MDLSYDPRATLYKKRGSYYVSYYLPNRVRVQRFLHTNQRLAKRLMRQKENELLLGQFDERDTSRMPEMQFEAIDRETLSTCVDKYLEATEAGRKRGSQRNDEIMLRSLTRRFDKRYPDEIQLVDIQLLIKQLIDEGKAQATLKTYRGILHKFFAWLDDAGVVKMPNPVSKKVTIPVTGGLSRDRLPTDWEIRALIDDPCEIQPIVRFLAFTGCRLGEALHLEIGDVDDGIWMVRRKPDCPTRFGMGWSPKWDKPREVFLFPEANKVLVEQLTSSSRVIGCRWMFPKADGSRRDSIKRAWASLKKRHGIEDLQVKDLRTWFNHVLKSRYQFSTKEASSYLGHSPRINEYHYDPISPEVIRAKLNASTVTHLLPNGGG